MSPCLFRFRSTRRPDAAVVHFFLLLAMLTAHAQTSGDAHEWTAIPLASGPPALPGFDQVTPADSGIIFTNALAELAGVANRVLENGSGVAAADFDGDGHVDLFFCGLSGNSTLYRNLGNWSFADVTSASGLDALMGETCRGTVFADLNADRQPDLLVATHARGVRCFLNHEGRFRESTAFAGMGGPQGSTTLALADIDGNGTPDLYVTRYRSDDIRDSSLVEARRIGNRTELHPRYAGRLLIHEHGMLEYGEPDVLYLNDGQARFRELSHSSGRFLGSDGRPVAQPHRDWGLTATLRDLTGDGLPDIYVCNDYWTPDRFWIQTADGRFQLAPASLLQPISENSMGIDAADLDRDGLIDFLVLDMLDPDPAIRRRQALAQSRVVHHPGDADPRMQVMRNTLFRARADGSFAEIAELAGLSRSGWSWQPLFLDVDLDGWEDVLIPTGHRRDVQDLDATEQILRLQRPLPAQLSPEARQQAFLKQKLEHDRLYPTLEGPIQAFRNLGNARFTNSTTPWNLDRRAIHQGAALADLDQDGDLDLVVNTLNGPAGLYRNRSTAPRIAIRLRGIAPNTDALGARIQLIAPPDPPQTREITAGGRYLSGSDLLVTFAATHLPETARLEITWRDGSFNRITPLRRDHLYSVDQQTLPRLPTPPKPIRASPLFVPTHPVEMRWPAAAESPPPVSETLLLRPTSLDGPGLAASDLNQDGWVDLLLGFGTRRPLVAFTNDSRGALHHDPSRSTNAASPLPFLRPHFIPPPVGAIALGQPDAHGPLRVLIGGTPIPDRFPEATPSQILKLTRTAWETDSHLTEALRDVGIVHAAVWADLDGDGDSDLVLACEWSPLRAFRSDQGRLIDVTTEWGFGGFSGLWLGLTVADLDNDGQLDVIAGNWGLNSSLTASPQQPAALDVGDLLGRDSLDALEGEWDPIRNHLVPRRRLNELEALLPPIRALFPTHRAFVGASLDQVIRAFGHDTQRRTVSTLASTAFLRRGDRFEARPLPAEAQVTPVFGIQSADWDGDGLYDLALAQNCSSLPWPEPPLNSGQGLLLRGIGAGAFEAVPPMESGLRLAGDQRGLAIADFNQDGRPDLAIARSAAPPEILLNRRGTPGLRVTLSGPPINPLGFGATVRLRDSDRSGPAIPVLGGSGWWSMNSPDLTVPVPSRTAIDARLEVRWPDGSATSHPLPANPAGRHVILRHTGKTEAP